MPRDIEAHTVTVIRCAIADFEGILPEFDPDKKHPAWSTLNELRNLLKDLLGEED